MGKKGWWRQLQSDEYPETQTSYGQDMEALKSEETGQECQPSVEPPARKPAKPIYDPDHLKKQNSSGTTDHSSDEIRLPVRKRSVNRYRHKRIIKPIRSQHPVIYCKQCWHQIEITKDNLTDARVNLRRYKCSVCGARKAGILSSKARQKR